MHHIVVYLDGYTEQESHNCCQCFLSQPDIFHAPDNVKRMKERMKEERVKETRQKGRERWREREGEKEGMNK